MGKIRSGLEAGRYAYSAHSLLLSGDIVEVFIGRWETTSETSRVLKKYPIEETVDEGEVLCTIKLRRPISLDEYREVHRPEIRPMVRSVGADVSMVMLPANMVCTIPDSM